MENPAVSKKIFQQWILGMLYGDDDNFDLKKAESCKKKSETIVEFAEKYNLFHPEIE